MPCPFSSRALLWTALFALCGAAHADSDALWRIIDTRCVPESLAGTPVLPCSRVELQPDRTHGWVVLKDLRGRLQFLLMPTTRISGIESPALEQDGATNYFALAWDARIWMDQRNGHPLPRDAVALAINSRPKRSQNQMHIHISCVQPALRARLLAAQSQIESAWSPLSGGWLGHAWFVRRVQAPTLADVNPFVDVQAHVPGASADMGEVTIGAVGLTFSGGVDGFVLMASVRDTADGSSGTAEGDLQDHDCTLLDTMPAPTGATPASGQAP